MNFSGNKEKAGHGFRIRNLAPVDHLYGFMNKKCLLLNYLLGIRLFLTMIQTFSLKNMYDLISKARGTENRTELCDFFGLVSGFLI